MKQYEELKGKVVAITGASGGVGRATAWEFAKQGARLALIARGVEGLEGAKKEVEQLGATAIIISLDLADADAVEKAVEQIETDMGPIEVWVNNAMNSVFAPFIDITPAEFRRVTEVTYLGQVYGTMSVLRRMRSRNHGAIIMVGSALAYRGIPLQSAYCGAKHGIEGMFDSLRTEILHDKLNIHISMVQLPALNTTQFGWVLSKLPNKPRPMGKVYQPEVAARAIVFASTHKRRSVWVGFPTYKAIIGNKIAPWYADWVLSRNGIKGQQTNEPASPDKKNNVWEPVPGDQGTYGDFGDIAVNHSKMLWLSMHREWVWTFLVLLLAALIYLIVE